MMHLKINARKWKELTNGQTNAIFLINMCDSDIINQNILPFFLLMPQQAPHESSLQLSTTK